MPFAVTRTPCGADPRSPCTGTNYRLGTGCSPWRIFAQTSGALPPFDFLNSGRLLQQVNSTYIQAVFEDASPPPLIVLVRLVSILRPVGPPDDYIVRFIFNVAATMPLQENGFTELLAPDPVTDWPAIQTGPVSGPPLIPNPMTFKIVAWNRDLPTY